MITSFSILASSLPRLANLRHATDPTTRGALAHFHLAVTGDNARFTASDGHLLAILKLQVSDFDGESIDILIDGALFAAACATLLRADHASCVRISIGDGEVRFIRGMAVAVARIVDLAFPITSAFIDRYRGQTLVPAIASYAPALVTAAARIAGTRKSPLLLWSAAPNASLVPCWTRDSEGAVPYSAIAVLLSQPGIWADKELFLLLMPVSRSCQGAPDIGAFIQAPLLSASASTAA
jgi:hypothetical protein